MARWQCALELDEARQRRAGSAADLCAAVRRGADLRVGTAFRHNEHIDTNSANSEPIDEVMDFRVVYLLEDRWVAGIQNLRMPVAIPEGFGARPSMSFFLYNQDGNQAIARPFLDGQPAAGDFGPAPPEPHDDMPKYHELASWDKGTNAPSSDFVYDFEHFRFFVCDQWREVYAHRADGAAVHGSVEALAAAASAGAEVKVAIEGLCADLGGDMAHQVFVHGGACYYYTEAKRFMVAAHPLVRTRPAIPLGYGSRSWDFGWLMPRSDGFLARWLCDPHTLAFSKSEGRYAMRWFVSKED